MKKEELPRRNTKGVNIENRITSGKTKFFTYDKRPDAIEYADRKGTYIEDCFRDKEFIGYTVPS
jgi:hypothetical protein